MYMKSNRNPLAMLAPLFFLGMTVFLALWLAARAENKDLREAMNMMSRRLPAAELRELRAEWDSMQLLAHEPDSYQDR